jgi:threonyl-tRNA synthetase
MRILQLDVNEVEYELVKPEAKIYEKSDENKVRVENALLLLVSIEKGDDKSVAEQAVGAAAEFAKKQRIGTMVIYPFAHLSSSLEAPSKALEVLHEMRTAAGTHGLRVVSSPFGWNKKLKMEIKGHPLAEMSRHYSRAGEAGSTPKERSNVAPESGVGEESTALRDEEKVRSTWYILDTEGRLVEAGKFDYSGHKNLKKFADYEIKKVRVYSRAPPHIRLMQSHQLVDYEAGSDAGNLRYYPNGRLVKKLLENYVTERVAEYGAVEVETPIMYDYEHPALKAYLHRFPARHYVVTSDDKEFFLRFSADFGQFLMVHDATISYKQLPFRFYELTRYSFRREKSGEVVGLKRLRAFTMPDMHTLCKDLESAREEFGMQFRFCQQTLAEIGIGEEKYEAAIRFTEEFWTGNGDFIRRIVREQFKRPVLIEMWSFRYAYFDPKFEFNMIDSMDKATALSTVQIDHENGERYGMSYVDSDGKKKFPKVLHCSPSGAIERVIYALLEFASIRQAEGGVPSLPLWLSPSQVRFLSMSNKHIQRCVELAEKLKEHDIRADVDDTDSTIDKKIRAAEQEWVPYICVIGDREASSSTITVRVRQEKKQEKMELEKLAQIIEAATKGMPKAPLPLPVLLSKRPIFTS